jgi:hypothetical protein
MYVPIKWRLSGSCVMCQHFLVLVARLRCGQTFRLLCEYSRPVTVPVPVPVFCPLSPILMTCRYVSEVHYDSLIMRYVRFEVYMVVSSVRPPDT